MAIQKSLSRLIVILVFSLSHYNVYAYTPACDRPVFCESGEGTLVHEVQMKRLFPDSKTFVDMSMKFDPAKVLADFDKIDYNNTDILREFVNEYFEDGSELEQWNATDYTDSPAFLEKITDKDLRNWASTLNSFWFQLGRQVKEDVKNNPDRYSMIYVENGVIVPGGRFKEFYYWDSYWIQIGLLHCGMTNTTKGMLENFLSMVERLGYVPNGGRIYFTRSQPPFLIPMVKNYLDATNDRDFIEKNIDLLDQEFNFWKTNRTVEVFYNDKWYNMARYNSEKDAPRPESYKEDYELAEKFNLTDHERSKLFQNLHSGAESGWDFSSRWWIKNKTETGDLLHTKTTDIIPADLNAILYLNAVTMAEFHTMLGNKSAAEYYKDEAEELKIAIEEVLWDENEGSWFDYDNVNEERRLKFYQSNIVPLWAGVNDSKSKQVYNYLLRTKSLEFPGGVPTSLQQTGEQWDFPNGWAPLEHFFVDTLSRFDESKEMAFKIAEKWTYGNYKAYLASEKMFEKYDVTYQGLPGGGGEYEVVIGFGWTNGVILDFLARYGDRFVAPKLSNGAIQISSFTSTTIALGSISVLLSSYLG